MPEYIVLSHDGDTWTLVENRLATDGEQAIRHAATAKGAGRYAAVPAHNWTEANVTVETEPRIRVETITNGEGSR